MDGYCHPILELAKTVLELRSLRNPLHAHDHPLRMGSKNPSQTKKPRRRAAQTDWDLLRKKTLVGRLGCNCSLAYCIYIVHIIQKIHIIHMIHILHIMHIYIYVYYIYMYSNIYIGIVLSIIYMYVWHNFVHTQMVNFLISDISCEIGVLPYSLRPMKTLVSPACTCK